MTTSWTEGGPQKAARLLNKAGNQELIIHCTVNHWRILIRKVTLLELRVGKIALTTGSRGSGKVTHQAGTGETDAGIPGGQGQGGRIRIIMVFNRGHG